MNSDGALITADNLPSMDGEVGAVSAVAREQSEIQAAIISAKRFPRDENAAYLKMIRSFERPSMAEAAEYRFPRGGKEITGPSVDLAREASRCWGNIRSGNRVVSIDDEFVHVKGYGYDLESNTYVETEDKFQKAIQRKTKQGQTIWIKPDERELRELVNRRAAICERNALLKLLPPDMVDDCVTRARETVRKAAAGELTQSREEAIRRLTLAFDRLGVTVAMLQGKLGHDLSLINETELGELRGIYKSVFDGNSTREEHFELQAKVQSEGAAELNASLRAVPGDVRPDVPSGESERGAAEIRKPEKTSLEKAQEKAAKMEAEYEARQGLKVK